MFRVHLIPASSFAVMLLIGGAGASTEPAAPPAAALKTAVAKALPLLKKGAEGHVAQRTCFACHNQAIPLLAFITARERGLADPEKDFLRKQRDFIATFLDGNEENYRQGKGQGGQADTAGYALLALEITGRPPDTTTEAIVEYLLRRDPNRPYWRTSGHRPPSENSDFTPTYLALRALHHWGTPAQKERIAKRVDAVRGWLRTAAAKDTEDRVFRLWALQAAGAEAKELRPAVQELLGTQRPDGGWRQIDTLDSDAYATGTALVALHQAGGLAVSDPAYQRGVAFLFKQQREDGSWLVRTRSRPFQTYFESGFPHGKNQFISMAASGWATAALALACPSVARDNPQSGDEP